MAPLPLPRPPCPPMWRSSSSPAAPGTHNPLATSATGPTSAGWRSRSGPGRNCRARARTRRRFSSGRPCGPRSSASSTGAPHRLWMATTSSQKWCFQFCSASSAFARPGLGRPQTHEHVLSDKPACMSETTAMSWAHLTLQTSTSTCARPVPPTHSNSHSPFLQIHFACNPAPSPTPLTFVRCCSRSHCRPGARRTPGLGTAREPGRVAADGRVRGVRAGGGSDAVDPRVCRCGVSRHVMSSLFSPFSYGRRIEDRYCRCVVIVAGKPALKCRMSSPRAARSTRLITGANI
jgi:hypothetical protein